MATHTLMRQAKEKKSMIKYAYTYQGCLVGYSDRDDVKIAGEINSDPSEWYTTETTVERCPAGDKIETPYGVKARWEIEKEAEESLKEEKDRRLYNWVAEHNATRKK